MNTCEHCRYPFDGESCPNPACRENVREDVWALWEARRQADKEELEFRRKMLDLSYRQGEGV